MNEARFAWLRALIRNLPREGEGVGGADGGSTAAPPASGSPSPSSDGGSAPADPPSLLAGAAAAGEGEKPAGDPPAADGTKPPEGEAAKPPGEGEKPPETPEEKAAREALEVAPKDVDGKPVPEKYEPTMPDGFVADDKLLGEVTPIFKENKFSPAQVQVAVDLYAKQLAGQLETHRAQVRKWGDEAKADKEIGGPEFDKNLGHAGRVFRVFGDKEALNVIDTYGLGNHPALLRLFTRVGKAMGEASTEGFGGASAGRRSDTEVFYPSMAAATK